MIFYLFYMWYISDTWNVKNFVIETIIALNYNIDYWPPHAWRAFTFSFSEKWEPCQSHCVLWFYFFVRFKRIKRLCAVHRSKFNSFHSDELKCVVTSGQEKPILETLSEKQTRWHELSKTLMSSNTSIYNTVLNTRHAVHFYTIQSQIYSWSYICSVQDSSPLLSH